jgi:hypothetical protein
MKGDPVVGFDGALKVRCGEGRERSKDFFFEKKKQKTFDCWFRGCSELGA